MIDQKRRDLLELLGPVYRGLRRAEERCAKDAGLSMWQYAILSIASQHEGLSQVQIADRLGYSKNRIINDLDFLQGRGLAERRTGTDRRRYSIHVTPTGRATVAEVREAVWSAEDDLLATSREPLQSLLEHAVAQPTRSGDSNVNED